MLIPVPVEISRKISERAAQLAREQIRGYNWSQTSIAAISADPGEGKVGLRTSAKYLMYQERGIQPFVMWWVKDRAVPLGCKQGDGPHIRNGNAVGTPGYVTIPHKGRVWRDVRWRHPGLRGRNFMERSIRQAIDEARPSLQQMLNEILVGARR